METSCIVFIVVAVLLMLTVIAVGLIKEKPQPGGPAPLAFRIVPPPQPNLDAEFRRQVKEIQAVGERVNELKELEYIEELTRDIKEAVLRAAGRGEDTIVFHYINDCDFTKGIGLNLESRFNICKNRLLEDGIVLTKVVAHFKYVADTIKFVVSWK
jgi:hypothetical protein